MQAQAPPIRGFTDLRGWKRPNTARTPKPPKWDMFFMQGKVTPAKRKVGMTRPHTAPRHTAHIPIPTPPSCNMCDYVKDELSMFETRRKSNVALSVTGPGIIDIPQSTLRRPPAVVTSVYSSTVRGRSSVIHRLKECNIEKLKTDFLRAIRKDGSIGKSQFVEIMRKNLKGHLETKALLGLYDSFETTHMAEVEYVLFFSYLHRQSGHTDPYGQLAEAWDVMRKEKSICGIVTIYELESIFRSLVSPPPGLHESVMRHLSGIKDLALFEKGECEFKDLRNAVASNAFLSSVFLSPEALPYETALREELKAEIANREK
eukprot:TRINITY_DN10936_c4_g1_i1.p1 TRINITY_DN10936_c4_g1~~TRINITY_DN10936_c4_g1_i1.p1  ORF type:complete len:327 (+),score=47.01 TRINITY_DN10936_c4_g1_i1:33-983(+)